MVFDVVSPLTALFKAEFRQEVFLWLGVIYFALVFVWGIFLFGSLSARWREGGPERTWIGFSFVAGLAFATCAAYEWGWPALGTALAVGLSLSLALAHSAAAAALLASSLYLRPWELIEQDPYLGLLPRLSFLLCLAHLFLHYARIRGVRIPWTRVTGFVIAFSGWCFLATLFAPDPSAAQSEYFNGFLRSVFLFFILILMVRDRLSLRLLVASLLLSFFFVGAVSVVQTFELSQILSDSGFRLEGFGAFKNSNDIAAIMVFILPFAAFVFLRKDGSAIARFFCGSLVSVALLSIVLSRSRGAMLGVAVMVAVYFLVRRGKRALLPVAIGLGLLTVPAMAFLAGRQEQDLEGSSAGRKTYLMAGLRMGLKNPLFGVGFNAFPQSLAAYSRDSLEEKKEMTAHNSWVLVWAETGVVGLLLFSGLYLASMGAAWRIYPESPEFLLALAGYGVAILFLSHSYLIYPYLLFALVQIASSLKRTESA